VSERHRFRIEAPDPTGNSCHVYMDGVELHGVVAVTTRVAVSEANRVTVEFIPESVDQEVVEDPEDAS
jgi:hypothetical protein